MKPSVHQTFITLTALVLLGSPLLAFDTVTKKGDGKKVSGTISAMSKTELTMKRPQGEETVAANDVAAIDWESGGPELKMGVSEENGGRFESAALRFQKAKTDAKSPSAFLQGEFDYGIARALARQALIDPEKRDQAIQKLLAAQKTYPDHVRYFDSILMLVQLQTAAKDLAAVQSSVELLKKAPWKDYQLAAKIAESRVLMSQGQLDQAISGFESAVKEAGETSGELARKSEAMLGHARGLILQSRFDDALKLLESITETTGPIESDAVQAEAYVLQGQALRGLGRNKEAALAYLHVDILFPKEASFHAEALYQLTLLWKLVQHPERSAEAAGKLVQTYPNSEWRKKLAATE